MLALLGAICGSFLNVVIWRLPRKESLVSPASHCPKCNVPIRPWDNVPVVSWLVLRGRCRKCKAPISPRYPCIEAVTALLFVATGLMISSPLALAFALVFGAAMIVVTFIDLDHRIIPDTITLPGTVVGLVAALLGAVVDPRQALLGVVLGGGGLFAVVGAFLGPGGAFLTILLGSIAGTLFACVFMLRTGAGRTTEFPFGTFLAPGAVVALLVGSRLMSSYWHLFS
jgi:leader peptidase (prepilin peptidase)/N-methyltransferase